MTMQLKYDELLKQIGKLDGTVGSQLELVATKLEDVRSDVAEIKADIKDLTKCSVDADKRLVLLERNSLGLHTQLEESKADRKSLREMAQKMEMNWGRLIAVVGAVTILMQIIAPEIGKVGEGLVKVLGGK